MVRKTKSFRQDVAEELIRHIEAGTAPWQKPWEPGRIASLPHNPATGAPYRGMNNWWLTLQDREDPRWLTYKQAAAVGAEVRKGEKATTVEYWRWTAQEPVLGADGQPVMGDDGKPEKRTVRLSRPKVFYAKVFNAGQIDGLEPYKAPAPGFEPLEKAEQVLAETGLIINHDQADRAYYSPGSDSIHLPGREAFTSAYEYYATALHEAGHATGHPDRLAREFGPFGSEVYAREELRAEIASCMTARTLGIGHDPSNHAAYVKSWVKVLKEDPNEIFRAARDAEVINNWIMQPEKRFELERAAQERRAAGKRQEKEGPEMNGAKVRATRHYLDVSYEEKNAAKKAGARWDRKVKAWYAPEGGDQGKLARWDTVDGKAPENTVIPPQVEFADACRDHGLKIDGDIVMDGQWHRVAVGGDRKGEKSGSYRGYLDGRPSGQITNFKEGGTVKWVASGQTLTAEDRQALKAEAATKRQEREDEQNQSNDAAAKKAYGVWANRNWAQKAASPYLKEKDVRAWCIKHDGKGGLIVPIRNVDGKLQSLQFIDNAGNKRMMAGGRKEGGMHFVDPKKEVGLQPTIIAEGYATAATLHEITGYPAVCAFDAGNLQPVAEALREKYPDQVIVIAADNDQSKARNVGMEKAENAATAVDAVVASPTFDKDHQSQGMSDFNDMVKVVGAEEVREQINSAVQLKTRKSASRNRTEASVKGDRGIAI